jgi:hypothetical protein
MTIPLIAIQKWRGRSGAPQSIPFQINGRSGRLPGCLDLLAQAAVGIKPFFARCVKANRPVPSCYAMTGWRRTESGRPAANIRFSTATPTAASARSATCNDPLSFLLRSVGRSRWQFARPGGLVLRSSSNGDRVVSVDPVPRWGIDVERGGITTSMPSPCCAIVW